MTFAVDRMNAVRSLRSRLNKASDQVDELRRKIVATKEGGMITGEERLREYVANLYGDVNVYDGRPTNMQTERAESLTRELNDVVAAFDRWTAKELPSLNAALVKKQLQKVEPLTREE